MEKMLKGGNRIEETRELEPNMPRGLLSEAAAKEEGFRVLNDGRRGLVG